MLLSFILLTKDVNEDLKRKLYYRLLKIILKRKFKLFN